MRRRMIGPIGGLLPRSFIGIPWSRGTVPPNNNNNYGITPVNVCTEHPYEVRANRAPQKLNSPIRAVGPRGAALPFRQRPSHCFKLEMFVLWTFRVEDQISLTRRCLCPELANPYESPRPKTNLSSGTETAELAFAA